MAPVLGKPFLEHLMVQLKKQGLTHFVLSVGYLKEKIQDYFQHGERWHIDIQYSEELEPMGTGGALKIAAESYPSLRYLVLNGDSVCQFNAMDFYQQTMASGYQNGMVIAKVKNAHRFGNVEWLESEQRVSAFAEKQIIKPSTANKTGAPPAEKSQWINAGVYLLDKQSIRKIPHGKSSLEQSLLPRLLDQGLFAYASGGSFIDMGIPEDYQQLQQHFYNYFPAAGSPYQHREQLGH